MILKITYELPMGHRLQHHEGKCKYLHGHNYLITLEIEGRVDQGSGMVMDFSFVKSVLKSYFEQWDHAMVLESTDAARDVIHSHSKLILLDLPPTAEVLTARWAKDLYHLLQLPVRLTVNETRDCGATSEYGKHKD